MSQTSPLAALPPKVQARAVDAIRQHIGEDETQALLGELTGPTAGRSAPGEVPLRRTVRWIPRGHFLWHVL